MMPRMQEEVERAKALEVALKKLVTYDVDRLSRRDLGDHFNFVNAVPMFHRVKELFEALSECQLDFFPVPVLQNLLGAAEAAAQRFDAILNMDPKSGNLLSVRDQLFQNLYEGYASQWFPSVSAAIAFAVRKGTDFDRLEREARGVVSQQQDVLKTLDSESQARLKEMDEALKQVRAAAAEAGVSQQAIYFNTAARRHLFTSVGWLAITIVVGVFTGVFAWKELLPHHLQQTDVPPSNSKAPEPAVQPTSTQPALQAAEPTASIVRHTVGRIVIVSLLTTLLLWCARNYSANFHNYVVNRHRQNCLSSFDAFVKAASGDTETKNAVLLQATQAIFAPQTTAFSHKESAAAQGSQIIEIVRGTRDLAGKPDGG